MAVQQSFHVDTNISTAVDAVLSETRLLSTRNSIRPLCRSALTCIVDSSTASVKPPTWNQCRAMQLLQDCKKAAHTTIVQTFVHTYALPPPRDLPGMSVDCSHGDSDTAREGQHTCLPTSLPTCRPAYLSRWPHAVTDHERGSLNIEVYCSTRHFSSVL